MGADRDPKATSDTVILAPGSHKGDETGIGEHVAHLNDVYNF